MEEDIRFNSMEKIVMTNRRHAMGWREVREIRLIHIGDSFHLG